MSETLPSVSCVASAAVQLLPCASKTVHIFAACELYGNIFLSPRNIFFTNLSIEGVPTKPGIAKLLTIPIILHIPISPLHTWRDIAPTTSLFDSSHFAVAVLCWHQLDSSSQAWTCYYVASSFGSTFETEPTGRICYKYSAKLTGTFGFRLVNNATFSISSKAGTHANKYWKHLRLLLVFSGIRRNLSFTFDIGWRNSVLLIDLLSCRLEGTMSLPYFFYEGIRSSSISPGGIGSSSSCCSFTASLNEISSGVRALLGGDVLCCD